MFGLSQKEKDSALLEAMLDNGKGAGNALRRSANPNLVYRDQTMLMMACGFYDSALAEATVAELLEKGAEVNQRTMDGRTVLHAVFGRDQNIGSLKRLLAAGADILAVDLYGETPLMAALRRSRWQEAKILLEAGGAVVTANKSGETLLHIAAAKEAPPDITALLLKTAVDINATRADRSTALHMMTNDKNAANLDLLLQAPGLALDIINASGRTPLHQALDNYQAAAALRLIQKGAAVDLADGSGQTALKLAALKNMPDVVEALVQAQAGLDGSSAPEHTPLCSAANMGSIRAVKAIIGAAQARPEKIGLDAPLRFAAAQGHARVLELLIEAGADVNAKDTKGQTALMAAALGDHAEAIEFLVKAGADPALTDNYNMQAYDHAVSAKRVLAKEILGRFRNDAAEVKPAGAKDYGYTRLNDHSLEVKEGQGLTMTFNFWTQQVMIRDLERPAPVTVINFSELQRQQAIDEAYAKLKMLGGNPPNPRTDGIQGKAALSRLTG